MIYFIIVGVFITIALRRNPLKTLDNVRFRFPMIMIFALLFQIILFVGFELNPQHYPYLLELTMVLLILGLLFNRNLHGVKWIVLGTVVNLVSIIVHNGRMPVMDRALELARLPHNANDARHQVMGLHDIWWLGDWIPLYKRVISSGDIFVGIGIIIFIIMNSKTKDTFS